MPFSPPPRPAPLLLRPPVRRWRVWLWSLAWAGLGAWWVASGALAGGPLRAEGPAQPAPAEHDTTTAR